MLVFPLIEDTIVQFQYDWYTVKDKVTLEFARDGLYNRLLTVLQDNQGPIAFMTGNVYDFRVSVNVEPKMISTISAKVELLMKPDSDWETDSWLVGPVNNKPNKKTNSDDDFDRAMNGV